LDSEAFYVTGPYIYTDEPAEVLTKKLNINTNQFNECGTKDVLVGGTGGQQNCLHAKVALALNA